MSTSPVADFVAHLKDNPDLRSKVEKMEESLKAAFRREAESIAAVAADTGFELTGWDARPEQTMATSDPVAFACCGFMTAGTLTLEKTLAE